MSRRAPPSPEMLRQFQARRERMLSHASPQPVLLMAFGILVFNLWDRWIDADAADTALRVRLITAAALLPGYFILRRGVPDRLAKYVHGGVFLIAIVGVAYASAVLRDGFLWAAAGTLVFPVILAFYSIPLRFYFALGALALVLIATLVAVLGVPTSQVVNFAVMYLLMIWVGSTALRVMHHQQLRTFMLELRHAEDARTDALTGLSSRRHIDELGRRSTELARRRQDKAIAVLMIDVDHFKRVNDERGHDVGDRVLRRVADVLRGVLRASDHLGRWGGEEFLAILPGAAGCAATESAQRAVEAMGNLDFGTDAAGLKVTISVGVGSWVEGGDWESLVKRADDALYRAKRGGRNRVDSDLAAVPAALGVAPP